MTESNTPPNSSASQAREIRSLARTLKVRASDLEFMNKIDSDNIRQLREEMNGTLSSRHHAFKQSLLYAREQLPLFSRLRVNKLFRRGGSSQGGSRGGSK